MQITRPMLCAKLKDPQKLHFPLLATPKLDGIRCLKLNGVAVSRAFKPIRNRYISSLIEQFLPDGIDGELIVNDGTFQDTASGIMSFDGKPDFQFAAFDLASEEPYADRLTALNTAVRNVDQPWLKYLMPTELLNLDDFYSYEEKCLAQCFEGVIVRSADGPYRCGRCTVREGYLFKYKRYDDSEAIILDFEEANENTNPVVPNAFGLSRRPGGSAGRVPKGTLGGLVVRDLHTGICFSIGTGIGLTQTLRQHIWDNRPDYLGRIITYRYQSCGVKDKPRFPSFQNFRPVS